MFPAGAVCNFDGDRLDERNAMSHVLTAIAILAVIAIVLVCAHFMVIEMGREVVTLRTESGDGTWKETRLWVVDVDGDVWLHSAGEEWESRFRKSTPVELFRNGMVEKYIAIPDRSKHAEVDAALREKYGLADQWVRFLAPCDDKVLPVRLRKEG